MTTAITECQPHEGPSETRTHDSEASAGTRFQPSVELPGPLRQLGADVLRTCLRDEYDEERRLLYVAMTRAEHHLVFTAGETPNTFIEELPVDLEEIEPAVSAMDAGETNQTALDVSVPLPDGPTGRHVYAWVPRKSSSLIRPVM